jgi:signal transduction histidine kinase
MYSHINRGASCIEAVDLNGILHLVEEDLELSIKERGAQLVVGQLPRINGHKRQLQQLFANLVGNAVKYCRNDIAPKVTVSSRLVAGRDCGQQLKDEDAEKQYHLIQVSDNGIGFRKEDAGRIFNVFTRLHGNTEYQGTGVGLSIARKVTENHNGYIWADAQPGEGATFNVLLPCD